MNIKSGRMPLKPIIHSRIESDAPEFFTTIK